MNLREQVEQAEEFLAQLGKGIPEDERVMAGYAKEATVQVDSEGKKLNAGWWPVPYAAGKYINGNDNCYVCISSSIKTPNPKTGVPRYWRGESSFGHGLALMVDDVGTGIGSKGELSLDAVCSVLAPTAIVQTSPSNYQLWYFLDEPCADMVRFKAFLTGFVAGVLAGKGGDSTIRDVSRYGRMPVGVNNKRHGDGKLKYPAGKPDEPVRVRLVSVDYTRRYAMDHIAARFGFQIVKPVARVLTVSEADNVDEEAWFNNYWLKIAVKILDDMQMGEGSNGSVVQNMSGKFRIQCPWGDEHSNGDVGGAYFRDRIPGAEYDYVFGCAHDTCRKQNKRTWSTFVDFIVIRYIADLLDIRNHQQTDLALSEYSEIVKC